MNNLNIERNLISYSFAETLIQEGDILLFRGTGFISWWIQKVTDGLYSHIGLASWTHDETGKKVDLECLEFREFIGSRGVNLKNYVDKNNGIIDVFRPCKNHTTFKYEPNTYQISLIDNIYNPSIITKKMREMTGLDYGYYRIWWMLKFYLFGIRILQVGAYNDFDKALTKHICSTIIAELFQENYTDLVKFRSNFSTNPSEISRSPILNYLFTLSKN